MTAQFEAKGTASLTRRFAAVVVMAVGLVLLISTFANNLFSVGPAFEEMIDDFRPILAEESIETARADLTMLGGVGAEFETAIVPALSTQLGMTPEEFVGFTSNSFPDVANGIQALPEIVPTFSGLIDTLDSQRELFASADAIPTESLPATTVPWGLFFAGIAVLVAGVFLYRGGTFGLALTGTLGVAIVIVTALLTLVPKASDADQLNDNLQPIYTAELVTQAQGALETVGAMGNQMQTEMLPALAQQLQMNEDQLNGFLGENFPTTAQALQTLPEAMGRFDGLVGAFDANLDNYDTIKPVAFSPIIWTLFISGAVMVFAFAAAWWSDRRADILVSDVRLDSHKPKEHVGV